MFDWIRHRPVAFGVVHRNPTTRDSVVVAGGVVGGRAQLGCDRGHCYNNQILTDIPTASFCLLTTAMVYTRLISNLQGLRWIF